MTRDDARTLMQYEATVRLFRDRCAVRRPGHLDVVGRRDHAAVLELIDRGDGERQFCRRIAIEEISIPFERHRDEHRRIARKPRVAIAARDFIREPSCVFRRVLRNTSPARHREQNKNP